MHSTRRKPWFRATRYASTLTVAMSLTIVSLSLAAMFARPTAAEAQTVRTGAFVSGQNLSALQSFESLVGRKQNYLLTYVNWDYGFNSSLAKSLVARGTTPYVTWEPWNQSLDGIISGRYDSYIRNYANSIKTVPGTVLLRPMHEMNGNWYPWGAEKSGNSPAKYVSAFRRITNLIRGQGASNVRMVWSPNVTDAHGGTSSISSYFPGSSYVDYVALDGYNFGTGWSWSRWSSFSTVFGPAYSVTTKLTTKPIIIGETASTERGGNKAAWISDAFYKIRAYYPRITGIVWFNTNKETDWRVNSSSTSLAAYKRAMASVGSGDWTGPALTLRNPTGTYPRARYKGIWLTASAYDRSGIAKVVFSVDGKIRYVDYRAPYAAYWSLKGVRGRHVIKVSARDKAGNLRTVTKVVYVKW